LRQAVKVTAAIMSSNGPVLIAQRKAGQHLPGEWEFLGREPLHLRFHPHSIHSFRSQESQKKIIPHLAVFWPVYCVTSIVTHLDMRRWMCLIDEPKPGAILWNDVLPWP
jgi:hypothetical protein